MTIFLIMGAIILVLWMAISGLCFKLSSVLSKYSRLLIVVGDMIEAGVSDEALEMAQTHLDKIHKRR